MAVSQSLSVAEQGFVASSNTSKVRILWRSTQSGSSYNGYTRTAKYYVSINGGAETEYLASYTLPKESTVTIVQTTLTVPHRSDGSGDITVRTWMDTDISAGVIEQTKTIKLNTIPRASSFDALSCNTAYFSGIITYKYTPKSESFYNKCHIAINLNGAFATVKDIYLGQKAASQQTETLMFSPSELSTIFNKFPGDTKGTLRFTLLTCSDSGYTTQIGDAPYKDIELTIPVNSSTQPTATMKVSPVSSLPSPFNTLYIKGRTKVDVNFTNVEGKYGAYVLSYSMSVEGKSYGSPYTSEYLTTTGSVVVRGSISDSRGFSKAYTETITVLPYASPRILPVSDEDDVVAARCDSNGNLSDNGTYLKIKAKRSYSKVISSGAQQNFCSIRYRYKVEGGSYSSWTTILDTNAESDEVITGALLGGALDVTKSYSIQVGVFDSMGESEYTTIGITTENVYMHRAGSRNSLGLGKYAERDNALDIGWDIYLNNHKLTGLPTPTNPEDAVPMSYVDAPDIKINQPLNALGWYKVGTLSGYMCAVATLTIGGTFTYNPPSPSMVDIAAEYYQARAILKLPSLTDETISKIGVVREGETNFQPVYGIYVYYNSSNLNGVHINIHTHMGTFVSSDLEVSSIAESSMISIITLKQ